MPTVEHTDPGWPRGRNERLNSRRHARLEAELRGVRVVAVLALVVAVFAALVCVIGVLLARA